MKDVDIKSYTKTFFKINDKLKKLGELLLTENNDEENRRCFTLCISEIYCRSKELVKIIDDISNSRYHKLTKENLDMLLSCLVNLKIEIYDEIIDWIKELKKPLNRTISEAAKKLDKLVPEEVYDEEWLDNFKKESQKTRKLIEELKRKGKI